MNDMPFKPRRNGTIREWQDGHYFLYITEWDADEDGKGRRHVEVEVFHVAVKPIWNSTDPNKIEEAKRLFFRDPSVFEQPTPRGELPSSKVQA